MGVASRHRVRPLSSLVDGAASFQSEDISEVLASSLVMRACPSREAAKDRT